MIKNDTSLNGIRGAAAAANFASPAPNVPVLFSSKSKDKDNDKMKPAVEVLIKRQHRKTRQCEDAKQCDN